MPSLLSKTLQGAGVLTFFGATSFIVWTKHSHFSTPAEFNASTDPLFQSQWVKRFNPRESAMTYDECVRRISLRKVREDVLEDAKKGGSLLVEEFVRGVWGGPGYTIQRLILQQKYRNDTTTAHQLWTPEQLNSSTYNPGTEITDHFVVLSKTPTSVLIRCGDSPLNNPDTPRSSDGLFEMCARADFDQGFAEFRLKSLFYIGDSGEQGGVGGKAEDGREIVKAGDSSAARGKEGGNVVEQKIGQAEVDAKGSAGGKEVASPAGEEKWENRGPMQGSLWYAHKLYTKLWMEAGVSRVKA